MIFQKSILAALVVVLVIRVASAEDWPMWRHGPQRSAASSERLPEKLTVDWQRSFPKRRQTWDDPLNADLMSFDRVLEPIIVGDCLVAGFNDSDKVCAFELDSGKEIWSFYAEGPVRLPIASHHGNVYFASDDGFLYCIGLKDGRQRWRFRGGPSDRHALGNERLVSAWPARGGPVVRDGVVYFAASIWPFMGVFIYALDADSGRVVWLNDETGSQYIRQPHSAPSFAGVGPQGALVATGNALIIPGGRSVPAVFDRQTGKQRYFELNAGGKGTGGAFVAASEKWLYVHTRQKGTRQFLIADGIKTAFTPNEPVITGDHLYSAEAVDGQPKICSWNEDGQKVWEIAADGQGDLILAGSTLYAAGLDRAIGSEDARSRLTAIELPNGNSSARALWSLPLDGTVERLIAGNGRLVAVTLEGSIYVLKGMSSPGSVSSKPREIARVDSKMPGSPSSIAAMARGLVGCGDATGYSLWYGAEARDLIDEVASLSLFRQLIVVDPSAFRIDALRRDWDARGWYGNRGSAHVGQPESFQAPPYIANMIFAGAELTPQLVQNSALLREVYQSVRPYGGVLHLIAPADQLQAISKKITAMNLDQAVVDRTPHSIVIRRVGALPGSGDWSHQHGNIANTIKSDDKLVKLPLGVLWFGGNSNVNVLPRHGHGPPEQVVGGRLIIEGINSLTARDVYTGRVLWERSFKDLGTFDVFYDATYADKPLDPAYNQVHIPGANGRGTNYVVTEDLVYVVEGPICHVLQASTGETVHEIALPQSDPNHPQEWGFIGIYEDVLIGGVGFARYSARLDLAPEEGEVALSKSKLGFGPKSLDRAASLALVGFDRKSGKQLWKIDAQYSFWHNGIVAGNGKLFALDRNPKGVEEALKRRGRPFPTNYRIAAFDIQSGSNVWEVNQSVFGTWLGYSSKHDMLLQAGAAASDRLASEVGQGMSVHRAKDGSMVWAKDKLVYSGPCILHNELIITNANSYTESAGAFSIRDGSQKIIKNPITGQLQPWKITRAYGCNTISASENMLTFRSGAAGYYDLLSEGGTGNLGGFRSGCTSNLVAANGILNAPDYTRTCSCGYQNQSSLGLVHMPELEMWTIDNSALIPKESDDVVQLGVNLGAPGDRRDATGIPWLEFPVVAGDSPSLGIELIGPTTTFQDHPMTMQNAKTPWITASGVEGLEALKISLKALSPFRLNTGLPVRTADEDAEEDANGAVNTSSSDLELVHDSTDQIVGLRFSKIPVASPESVRSAYLQFTAHAQNDEPTELTIHAELSGDAMPFDEKVNNLSSRAISKGVPWSPAAWKSIGEAGASQRSPDLSGLVQQVMKRPDWKAGNAIAFFVKGNGKRVASAFSAGKSGATRLIMDADEAPIATILRETSESTAPKAAYRVRLFFGLPKSVSAGPREFEVSVAGTEHRLSIQLDGSKSPEAVYTFDHITLGEQLELGFRAISGKTLLSGVEIVKRH